jgi:hypothetical protein
MVAVVDFPAGKTPVTTVNGRAAAFDRFLAIEGFGQRASKGFERLDLMAAEEIAMAKAAALERALEQLDALLLVRKICECHRASILATPNSSRDTNFTNRHESRIISSNPASSKHFCHLDRLCPSASFTIVRIERLNMYNGQLEMSFANGRGCQTIGGRQRRLSRAQWWFQRMRQVVERAIDWTPAPLPPPEQIWLPGAQRQPALAPAPAPASNTREERHTQDEQQVCE